MAPDPANFLISSLKKNLAKNYMAPDPANFLISSLKKNPAENYMAPDPANFPKRIWQKIIWLQIPPTFSSAPSKRIRRKIIWLQIPPTFQKESGKKLYGSRSRQLSHQLPQKESGR
jgi:hypothetical protein